MYNRQILVLILFQVLETAVSTECKWDSQCEELYRPGVKCMANGQCSSPFAAGCLHNFYSQYGKWDEVDPPDKRACNSDDEHDSDNCEWSPFNYSEIRVHNSNWESAIFYSWIVQIFLSEFLNVPVTVGLSDDTQEASFYNINSTVSYSAQSYPFDALVKANDLDGRCDLTDADCAHVMPEVWNGQEKKWKEYLSQGQIDHTSWDGQVGKISWYIPYLTAQRHPTVTSFHGMAGRREHLADIFLRPTSWGDYCREESASGCLQPDDVAKRAPVLSEEEMYFSADTFTGYFRPTYENNCTANPDTCTGHIVGPPCTWSTHMDAQAYHNDIALESSGPLIENNGYTYSQMIQIWRAANATESDVMMWWFSPDVTVEEFRGTSYEFQQVLLPEPTFQCQQGRIQPDDRCNIDPAIRRGDPEGGCDDGANSLQTIMASSMREISYNSPDVDRNPAYQAIRNLKISHYDMNLILQDWVAEGYTGIAAREAVCSWVIEHQDELKSYIPAGFPRVFVDKNAYKDPLLLGARCLAVFSFLYVLVNLALVYVYRRKKVFVYAQVPFIVMVLFGLLLVAAGSILTAIEPQDEICIAQSWLVTLGYTMELVPLLVKVAAINRLMAATKRMRRVQISMHSLFVTVAVLVVLVVIFLTFWTIFDAPHRSDGRYLANDFEIVTTLSCSPGDRIWEVVVLCWYGALIVGATVLAFQSRSIKEEFNESQSLGTMIYSHFVLTVLLVIANNFQVDGETDYPPVQPSTLAAAASFLMSFDVITAVSIYVVPKVYLARKPVPVGRQSLTYLSTTSLVQNSEKPYGVNHLSYDGTQTSSRLNGIASFVSIDRDSMRQSMNPSMLSRASLPSINEEVEESVSSNENGERNVGQKGPMLTVLEEANDSHASTDEEDSGGPRFSRISATGQITSQNDSEETCSQEERYPTDQVGSLETDLPSTTVVNEHGSSHKVHPLPSTQALENAE